MVEEELAGLIAALQEELFEMRGETAVMNREMITVDEQLSQSKEAVARLRGDVSDIKGQFEASQDNSEIDSEAYGRRLDASEEALAAEAPS